MDWNAVTEADLDCPAIGDTDEQLYQILIFNGRVMAVTKSDVDKIYSDARLLLESLAAVLPGRRGPVHHSFADGLPVSNDGTNQSVPVDITYVDDGNLRVVIATQQPYESYLGRSWTTIDVAYVDLPLWAAYARRVQADFAGVKAGANKAEHDQLKDIQNKL